MKYICSQNTSAIATFNQKLPDKQAKITPFFVVKPALLLAANLVVRKLRSKYVTSDFVPSDLAGASIILETRLSLVRRICGVSDSKLNRVTTFNVNLQVF